MSDEQNKKEDRPKVAEGFKIEIELQKRVEEVVVEKKKQKDGFTKGDWYNNAVRHYLECDEKPSHAMKFLKNGINYDTQCVKCGRDIKAGEPCQSGKEAQIFCIDCFIGAYGDAALLAKYLKMRYYERLIRELEKKSDELAQENEILQLPAKGSEAYEKDKELAKKLDEYLTRKMDSNPESVLTREQEEKLLDVILGKHMELERRLTDINIIIEQQMKKKKKRKELEEMQTAT